MGLQLKNRYLRLTVYSYLSATELLQKITVLSKFERNLVKTSKLYEYRGDIKIQYFSKKKFPLAIFLYATQLQFKLSPGKNTQTTQTMEILKRMPMKFKNFGVNMELNGLPDNDLINVVLDNNIKFNSLRISYSIIPKDFTDHLRKFMKTAKTLILDEVRLRYNFQESNPKEPNNIESLQIRSCEITGASELVGEKLSDLEIQASSVDNGIFDNADNYIKSITLKDVELTRGEYRYTRLLRMLKNQRILKKVHITNGYLHNSQVEEICDQLKNKRNIECSIHLKNDKRTFHQVLFQMDFLIKYPFLDYKLRCIESPALIKEFPHEGDNNLLSRTYLDREDYREIKKYYFKIYKENDVLVFIKRNKKQFKIGCLDEYLVRNQS